MKERNIEFVRLLRKSGWNGLQAAAALKLSSGAISQYTTGATVPSETVLELFRHLVGERGEGEREQESEVPDWSGDAIYEALADLTDEERRQLADIASEALMFLKNLSLRREGTNSDAVVAAALGSMDVARAVAGLPPRPSTIGKPTARKPRPRRGAGGG